jgi:hypothetical protein
VEDEAKPLAAPQRQNLRQEKSLPRLERFQAWLESQQAARGGEVLPKSPMGQAITYTLNQWEALCGVRLANRTPALDDAEERRGGRAWGRCLPRWV